VYQPRGVGLMHTRNNPGKAHYTHGITGQGKSRSGVARRGTAKNCTL
jgi:hypothetical protein